MRTREITGIAQSRPTLEGAGVHLRRAFGFHDTNIYDPFLLLDDFRGEKPEDFIAGFPWHPHRGIETITYMLAGSVEHGDSMGNKGTILPGGVQWMTAGRGVVHQEMPKPDHHGRMGGFQLWANLPSSSKMLAPRYQEFPRELLPVVDLGDGVTATVVCGEMGGVTGPVSQVEITPGFFDVSIPAGRTVAIPTPATHKVFAYVFEGSGFFDTTSDPLTWEIRNDGYTNLSHDPLLKDHTLIRFGAGEQVKIVTGPQNGVRFLLFWGKPLEEPIAWGGPIVMNTREELKAAFKQLEDGTFLSSEAPRT